MGNRGNQRELARPENLTKWKKRGDQINKNPLEYTKKALNDDLFEQRETDGEETSVFCQMK